MGFKLTNLFNVFRGAVEQAHEEVMILPHNHILHSHGFIQKWGSKIAVLKLLIDLGVRERTNDRWYIIAGLSDFLYATTISSKQKAAEKFPDTNRPLGRLT